MNFIKIPFLFIALSIHAANKVPDDAALSRPANHLPLCLRTLNPAKGLTVWRAPETTKIIRWESFGRGVRAAAITLDGELEITVSPFTWCHDYLRLLSGLHFYNNSKLDPSYLSQRSFKLPESDITGAIIGESVFLGCKSFSTLKSSLSIFENDAWAEGSRRIFVSLDKAKGLGPLFSTNPENAAIYTFLQEKGYVSIADYCNFMTGAYDSVLMKEMDAPDSVAPSTIEWAPKINDTLPELHKCFGVFVRNSTGTVLGGAWGSLNPHAVHPHAHINIFFMDESIRGTGLGRQVMDFFELYVKSHGITLLVLETCDFQAPWFYMKIGYKCDATIPKLFKDTSGNYTSSHDYSKQI